MYRNHNRKDQKRKLRMILKGILLAFTVRDMNSFMKSDFCSENDVENGVSYASKRRSKSTLNGFDWKNKLLKEMMNCEFDLNLETRPVY
jgi:hypothetical protein